MPCFWFVVYSYLAFFLSLLRSLRTLGLIDIPSLDVLYFSCRRQLGKYEKHRNYIVLFDSVPFQAP